MNQEKRRFRRFTFTINNWSNETLDGIAAIDYRYVIIGNEIGAEKGTPHLQGYIEMNVARTFTAMIKIFKKRAHLEVAMGTDEQNRLYCTKDNLIYEDGTPAQQGARNDIKALKPAICSGKTIKEMIEDGDIINYQGLKFTESLMKYLEPKRNARVPPEVIWCYGPAGSGKSYFAHLEESKGGTFKPVSFKWWEGYDRQKIIILDELRGDFCKYHEFLKLIDIYNIRVECKNGSRELNAQKFIITSSKSPYDMWCVDESQDQLLRRITRCLKFSNGNYTEVKLGNNKTNLIF